MSEALETEELPIQDQAPLAELGSITLRVVVLPPKQKKTASAAKQEPTDDLPLDLAPDELLPDAGASPLGSYLESSRGKRSCVFLVNGQRQDALDNSFIVQELGFRYLRNRMMIVVDVDGLTPEAIGRLVQGSRQGFYKGDTWNAIVRRVVATLKRDPELLKLEEEAEELVSELKAGDEKVKHTLDQLIDAHHDRGLHFAEGAGVPGDSQLGENFGLKTAIRGGVVYLLPPEHGEPADYPVLFSQPASSAVRLRPSQSREISIKSLPSNAWPALAMLTVKNDPGVTELRVTKEQLSDHAKLTLLFDEPQDFDTDQYPIRAKIQVTASFNGIKEPRQIELRVVTKPDQPTPEPKLFDVPTKLAVTSREPIRIRRGETDTHVRLRWDGKDQLLTGVNPAWRLAARLNGHHAQPIFNFSEPSAGRFTLLISPRPEWGLGERLIFEVTATDQSGGLLYASFAAEIVEPPPAPVEKGPRLIESDVTAGTNRRPPYELKYIKRDDYDVTPCWGVSSWTDEDPGCFKEPTDRAPLTLIINEDMGDIREYRRFLAKKSTETEVERRINKYTSHVAYHLYQMYQATVGRKEENLDLAEARRREEIRRVALTLIKLMEISR